MEGERGGNTIEQRFLDLTTDVGIQNLHTRKISHFKAVCFVKYRVLE